MDGPYAALRGPCCARPPTGERNCVRPGGDGSRALTPHPLGDAAKILCNNVPVALGAEIAFLQRAVFGWPCDEGGFQSVFLSRLEVAVMGGDHHHLLRR